MFHKCTKIYKNTKKTLKVKTQTVLLTVKLSREDDSKNKLFFNRLSTLFFKLLLSSVFAFANPWMDIIPQELPQDRPSFKAEYVETLGS